MAVNHISEVQIISIQCRQNLRKIELVLQESNFMEINIFKEPEDLTIKYHIRIADPKWLATGHRACLGRLSTGTKLFLHRRWDSLYFAVNWILAYSLHVVQIDLFCPVFSDAGHIINLCWRKGALVLHLV